MSDLTYRDAASDVLNMTDGGVTIYPMMQYSTTTRTTECPKANPL